MAVNVITPSNLGNEFDLGVIEQSKIHIKVDGNTIKRDATTGVLSAEGLQLEDLIATGHAIANIKDAAGATIGQLKETIIQIADGLNSTTITGEDGVPVSITKVGTVSITLDPVAKTIQSVVNGVASTAVDISAFYADINVDSIDSTDAANYIWKFKETDGTEHVLDLSSLVAITTTNGQTITFTGNGTVGSPLSAELKVDSTVAGNLLKTGASGAYVNPTDVTALATVDVQDAFGNHLYYAMP
jgi:hypothetical protein